MPRVALHERPQRGERIDIARRLDQLDGGAVVARRVAAALARGVVVAGLAAQRGARRDRRDRGHAARDLEAIGDHRDVEQRRRRAGRRGLGRAAHRRRRGGDRHRRHRRPARGGLALVDDLGAIVGDPDDARAVGRGGQRGGRSGGGGRRDHDRQRRHRRIADRGGRAQLVELVLEIAQLAILGAAIAAQLGHGLVEPPVVVAQRRHRRRTTDHEQQAEAARADHAENRRRCGRAPQTIDGAAPRT